MDATVTLKMSVAELDVVRAALTAQAAVRMAAHLGFCVGFKAVREAVAKGRGQ